MDDPLNLISWILNIGLKIQISLSLSYNAHISLSSLAATGTATIFSAIVALS